MAWLSGWKYRKSVPLSRPSGAVTNYQMKLLVGESAGATGEDVDCNSHCQTNFGDLRFTTSDGQTLLDHWIELVTGTTPNQLATVRIEFDSIGTGATTFYMYYGPISSFRHIFYNGLGSSGYYKIGFARGEDLDYGFTKYESNPILSEGGIAYDNHGVCQPFVIKIGSQYVMYYLALSSTDVFSIAIATSNDGITWTRYGSNPVLQKGSGGQWDQTGVNLPAVFDTGVVGSKRYRMLYTGYDGTHYQIGYAYSEDGFSWTKGSANPVITYGSPGAWDELHTAAISNIILVGSTYYAYYNGLNATRGQTGLVTFTDFEGTYTKSGSNPVIPSRTDAKQTLTSQTNSGTKVVLVADTSVFAANEPVFLCDGIGNGSNNEFNRIASIDSSTQLTLQDNVIRNYPGTTSTIRSWLYGSNGLTWFTKSEDVWKAWISCYRMMSIDYPAIQKETTGFLTSSDGISWTIDYANSPPLLYDPETTAWDEESVENIRLINFPEKVTTSNGYNTFSLLFDDYERGVNGDNVGGIWTIVTGSVKISIEQKFGGTRSCKIVGGVTQPSATAPLANSINNSIYLRIYKENAADFHFIHGNGTKCLYLYVDTSENINYYDTATRDTGVDITPDAWQTFEINNIDFSAGTFDIYYNGALIKSGATMWTSSSYANVIRIATGSAAGNDTYLDNVLVRNWRSTEPVWGSWGEEEEVEPSPGGISFVIWIN